MEQSDGREKQFWACLSYRLARRREWDMPTSEGEEKEKWWSIGIQDLDIFWWNYYALSLAGLYLVRMPHEKR